MYAYTNGTKRLSTAVISRSEKRTVTPCRTAAPVTDPVAAVSVAMAGRIRSAKSPILEIVSRPNPTMVVISLTVRAVIASAPASSTAPRPTGLSSSRPWARPHSSTTASSFNAVPRLWRSRPPS